jgi:hypothetical protein
VAIKVYAQVPLNSLTCQHTQLNPGQSVTVIIVLNSPAPASGTRVYLAASSDKLTIPKFVDVPADNTHVNFDLAAASDVSVRTEVTLTASTVGKPQVLRFVVAP